MEGLLSPSLTLYMIASMNILNLVQNLLMVSSPCRVVQCQMISSFQTVGLLVGSMIVAQRVVNGQLDPSRFVLFIAYLAQVSLTT